MTPRSSGSYQAPVAICTTPGRTASVTTTPASMAPRSLNTRTTSCWRMPRAAASAEFIFIGSRPAILLSRLILPWSYWPCRREAGCGVSMCSGNCRARALPRNSSLGCQTGWPGHSS
jgi:hypothetical protein